MPSRHLHAHTSFCLETSVPVYASILAFVENDTPLALLYLALSAEKENEATGEQRPLSSIVRGSKSKYSELLATVAVI